MGEVVWLWLWLRRCRSFAGRGSLRFGRYEPARQELRDLPRDARDIERALRVERRQDDLLDPADDEFRHHVGVKGSQDAALHSRAHVGLDQGDHVLIDLGDALADEARAAGDAKDHACRVGVGERNRHDLAAARLDVGDVVLMGPPNVSWQLDWPPLLDRIDDTGDDAIDQRGEEVPLVPEVLIQRSAGNPRPRTDIRNRRFVKSLGREDLERAVEDVLATILAAQIRAAGLRGRGHPARIHALLVVAVTAAWARHSSSRMSTAT